MSFLCNLPRDSISHPIDLFVGCCFVTSFPELCDLKQSLSHNLCGLEVCHMMLDFQAQGLKQVESNCEQGYAYIWNLGPRGYRSEPFIPDDNGRGPFQYLRLLPSTSSSH